MPDRRHINNETLHARLAALEAKLARYQRSPAFGCYTRQALEIDILPTLNLAGFAIIHIDIDGLSAKNELYGKDQRIDPARASVNERVSATFASMRNDDTILGQWFSGDEFIALLAACDACGFASRLQAELNKRDLTATMTILDYTPAIPILEACGIADSITAICKAAGLRNRIHDRPAVLA